MRYEIEFHDDGPADVEIALGGSASPIALREFSDALERDPRFRAGLRMLVDISQLDPGDVADGHIAELAQRIVARDWDYAPGAVAIVAPDVQTFRGAQAYRAHLGGSKSNRHIVNSRAEGLAWLEEQRARSDG